MECKYIHTLQKGRVVENVCTLLNSALQTIFFRLLEYVFLLTYLLHRCNIYFARHYVIQGAGEKSDAFVIEGS